MLIGPSLGGCGAPFRSYSSLELGEGSLYARFMMNVADASYSIFPTKVSLSGRGELLLMH